jgi:uncharacterized zinc-type alcohol dehydrogenase-like protein
MTFTTPAWGARTADTPLEPITIQRREALATDVRIKVEYCGICHSDVHTARDEWDGTAYPCVPGHEVLGIAVAVGREVTKFKVGDRVGIGCLVSACGACDACEAGREQYCETGWTGTYNSSDPYGTDSHTHGGYSSEIVVDERFVLRIPDGLDPAAAAPILCAGITLYSPLKHWAVGPGSKIAILGFGGLGAMGVKLAKALGAEVTVITRTEVKAADALKAGADHVLVSSDAAQMNTAERAFEAIFSTIPRTHDMAPYLQLLKNDGCYVILGAVEPMQTPFHGATLMGRRISIAGSLIGGIPETQEVLDFCAEHGIASDVQVVGVDGINAAYDHIAAGDPGFRYVIDMSTI